MKQGSVTAALLGVVAAALAVALGEFVGVAFGDLSLVASVGDVVVDLSPGWFVRWTIGLLGDAQKPALLTGVVVVVVAVAITMCRMFRCHFKSVLDLIMSLRLPFVLLPHLII